jgi:hypothetical protein
MTDVEVNFVVLYITCEMCRVLWGHISQPCEISGIKHHIFYIVMNEWVCLILANVNPLVFLLVKVCQIFFKNLKAK